MAFVTKCVSIREISCEITEVTDMKCTLDLGSSEKFKQFKKEGRSWIVNLLSLKFAAVANLSFYPIFPHGQRLNVARLL